MPGAVRAVRAGRGAGAGAGGGIRAGAPRRQRAAGGGDAQRVMPALPLRREGATQGKRMFGYYLDLALRSLKRNPVLTALMVLAIGLGIGASMTMITVLHVMSGDPLPGRSAQLFYPQLDPRPLDKGTAKTTTWARRRRPRSRGGQSHLRGCDGFAAARNARRARRRWRAATCWCSPRTRTATRSRSSSTGVTSPRISSRCSACRSERARLERARRSAARARGGDHAGIAAAAVRRRRRRRPNAAAGRTTLFTVIGVPDLVAAADFLSGRGQRPSVRHPDQVFVPFLTAIDLELSVDGTSCWGDENFTGKARRTSGDCAWVQFWVQLDMPRRWRRYRQFLHGLRRDSNTRSGASSARHAAQLYPTDGVAGARRLVPGDVRLQLWLALALPVRVHAQHRRAAAGEVPAPQRRDQRAPRDGRAPARHLPAARHRVGAGRRGGRRAGLADRAGRICGACASVRTITRASRRWILPCCSAPSRWRSLASVLAGLLPAWRACRVPPALQLKSA